MSEILCVAGTEVEVSGSPGRPLLLMTRMASRRSGIWDDVRQRLASDFRLGCFDLPMPDADGLADPRALFARFAASCRDIADALETARFHILGWDGGAHVALWCASLFRERTASAALVAPSYQLEDMRGIDKGAEILCALLARGEPELYAFYWFMGGLSEGYVEKHFDHVARLAKARAARDRFLRLDLERVRRWIGLQRRQWLTDAELAAIAVPILIAAPSNDFWHAGPTQQMARALHARMPASVFTVLKGTGHLCLMERPDTFCEALRAFLEPTESP